MNKGVSLWLRQRSGAVDALTHAVAVDPHFALAHCTRAYVAWRMGQVETALAAHQQAMTLADAVHEEREHFHWQTVDAMRSCNGAAALHHLEAIADRYPADRMAMRVLSFNYIARGDYQSGVTQALSGRDEFWSCAAMIMHNDDSASAKRRVLAEAGVRVAATLDEIIPLLT